MDDEDENFTCAPIVLGFALFGASAHNFRESIKKAMDSPEIRNQIFELLLKEQVGRSVN